MNVKNDVQSKINIMIVERIMIKNLKPKYNDLFYSQQEIESAYHAL